MQTHVKENCRIMFHAASFLREKRAIPHFDLLRTRLQERELC